MKTKEDRVEELLKQIKQLTDSKDLEIRAKVAESQIAFLTTGKVQTHQPAQPQSVPPSAAGGVNHFRRPYPPGPGSSSGSFHGSPAPVFNGFGGCGAQPGSGSSSGSEEYSY